MKIAVPVTDGRLCPHFGHCELFAFFEVADDSRTVVNSTTVSAPEHVPGLLPKWLHERGATVVLAGGMGDRAQVLLKQAGIAVVTGAESAPAEELVSAYLNGTLQTDPHACEHHNHH